MQVTARISTAGLKAAFARFSAQDQKAILEKTIRTDAMGFVRDVIAITPPGHQGKPLVSGAKGESAVAAGEAAIRRDAKKLAVPVKDGILDRAAAQNRDGDKVVLWRDDDGTLVAATRAAFMPRATVEMLTAMHASRFVRGRMRGREIKRINEGKWSVWRDPVVPRSVFDAFVARQIAKVGKLAGGWVAAARALKVRPPKIASRHAAGQYLPLPSANGITLRITNDRAYATEADVSRRVQFVLDSDKRAKRLSTRIKVEIEAKLRQQLAIA